MFRRYHVPALLLAALLTLSGCGGKEAIPETYQVSKEETIPSFSQSLPEETRADLGYTPQGKDKEAPNREGYLYSGLSNVGQAVKTYVEDLKEEYDCQVLNESFTVVSAPDYGQTEGEVTVGKECEDGVFTLDLTWTADTCLAERDFHQGESITKPKARSLTGGAEKVQEWLTRQGEDLKNYRVWADEGLVRVDDTVCIQVAVYTAAEHAFVATYLVPAAGEGLYQLDRDTRQVIVLEDPAGAGQADEGEKTGEEAKQSDKK